MDNSTKGLKTILVILVVVLVILIGLYLSKMSQYSNLRESSKNIQNYLQAEKDTLTSELVRIRDGYKMLETNNDSMNLKLEIQKAKIEQLLRLRADNLYVIQKYKNEIGTLREVLKSYVIQVDSLLRIKGELQAENKEVKYKLVQSEESNKQLQDEKSKLTSKVEQAAALIAKNVTVVGLNKKGKEKNDIDKIEKLKTCFTIRENSVTEPGPRFIYMRIIRPDEVVLTSSAENLFTLKEEKVVYSAKREVNYQNVDIDMCIYYDCTTEELIPGTYKVNLYSEGYQTGESSFTLEEGGLF